MGERRKEEERREKEKERKRRKERRNYRESQDGFEADDVGELYGLEEDEKEDPAPPDLGSRHLPVQHKRSVQPGQPFLEEGGSR